MKLSGITLKELAEKLGISPTTVSRILNGKAREYRISRPTEERVKEAAERYDYAPSQIARGLRLQSTNTIGLILPDISNPFFAGISKTIEQELRKEGKLILLCDTLNDPALERESLVNFKNRQVDGLIITPAGSENDHFAALYDSRLPMVFIDRYFPELPIPYVASDNRSGAYKATTHLIENGHRRIACIQGLAGTTANNERVLGFKDALADEGIDLGHIHILGDDFGLESGYTAAGKLLRLKRPPTAIFTLSNLIGIGAMQAIGDAGLTIPSDISIISFDEQPYLRLLSPPLTTISQQVDLLARRAVKILMDQIEHGKESDGVLLETLLIQRNSVKNLHSDG